MDAQTPAKGIMQTMDFDDLKAFRIQCDCQHDGHNHTLMVEKDPDTHEITVTIETDITTDFWWECFKKRYDIANDYLQWFDWAWKELVNTLIIKLKLSWRLWTKGYIRTESTIVMNQQQTLNYAETLKTAIKDVEIFEAKRNGNS
jgi:hypothetical protein